MADPIPSTSTSTMSSTLHILCKSIFFVFCLVAIPFFPSQAPNFINQTLLTNFWELVHLLFIGLVVCYGLFSRRNADLDFDVPPPIVVEDPQSSSFVSRIFHVSPIFEDGSDSPSGFDHKTHEYHNWDSVVTGDDKGASFDGKDESLVDSENGCEISFENDQSVDNVIESWNSQYFQGESVAVVSKPKHESLGLPVRRLNSRVGNLDSSQFSNGGDSSLSSNGSSSSSRRSAYVENFGDTSAVNLEGEFDENVSLPPHISWQSRSHRMEMKENVNLDYVASHPTHFRPLSVDETQFESLKLQSFGSVASLSSPASSVSDSPTRLSSATSVYSELLTSEAEELENKNSYRASYPPVSQSSSTETEILKRETRLNAFHLRRYSSGSLFQKDSKGIKQELMRELGRSRRGDSSRNKEREQGSSKVDKKPATPIKASTRGKSVRTIRASTGYAAEMMKASEKGRNYIDNEMEKIYEKLKSVNKSESEMKAGEGSRTYIDEEKGKKYDKSKSLNSLESEMKRGLDNLAIGANQKNLESCSPLSKPPSARCQKRGKEDYFESAEVKSKDEFEWKTDEFQVKVDEDAVADTVSEAGSEVDRKAGEFIAKFREQIRLQKVASIERSRVKNNNSVNHFR